jgi:hypothetical protein
MLTVACTAEQITPQWLTNALRESGHLSHGTVTAATHEIIGTGKMGDNLRFSLSYDGDYGAPQTLVAKLPSSDESTRAIAGAMGAYYHEVMFYKHLAGRTNMRTPSIYANEISPDGTEFITLMEDLAPAEPGSQLTGESLPHTRLALREAAKLAASFHGDTEIGSLDYVSSSTRTEGGIDALALMQECWPQFADRFRHGLSKNCIAFAEHYVDRHAHFATRFQGPKTLTHGDFRCENVLFGADTATVVDWQTVGESSALTDAAYFLGGSVDTQQRREWEKTLVADYSQWLDEAGVTLGFRECWEQYREFAMHGIVITVLGAVFTQPEPRSDKMFLAMIQRHLQQCVDLDSAEFL